MAVAPSSSEGAVGSAPQISPGLERARELARDHNLIALSYSFIDDCETPVSALLKLRALAPGEPAFLLESAEQGQRVGRWSFIGVGPRSVLRWSLGDGGDPYAIAAARAEPLPPRARRGRAPVRRRRGGLLRLRPRAHRRAAGRAPAATRSGCPTWR